MVVTVTSESIDNLHHECMVLGFFSDERPPRGLCGFADWRLNGAVSRLMARGRVSGAFLEKVLVCPEHRLPSQRILLMGLGTVKELTYEKLHAAGFAVSETVHGLQCLDPAVDIPGIGRCSLETAQMALAVTSGFFDHAFAHTHGEDASLSVSILGSDDQYDEIVLGLHQFKVSVKSQAHIHINEMKG